MLEACPQLFSFFKHEFQDSLVNTVKILSIRTYRHTRLHRRGAVWKKEKLKTARLPVTMSQ